MWQICPISQGYKALVRKKSRCVEKSSCQNGKKTRRLEKLLTIKKVRMGLNFDYEAKQSKGDAQWICSTETIPMQLLT